ncbi:adenosylcobinamide-GDP ribazoletransferase [Roseovarius salinarum]|uniref:adenosylcobinamide-GDP ribazoletransferase n=1 Tax=Roseovarius salinarum TaxID=1981892 RepID=UPI000C3469E3|nr:adenosylcobinamide-GDP ribazoletransferase [Roseovarius salinarum]
MRKTDPFATALRDVSAALGLLSRLPVPLDAAAMHRGAAAAWAYPLAGLMLGGVAGLAAAVALGLGLPAQLAALAALAAGIAATGAMHEDGLADCADGFWGGWDRADRLAIMKDSRIGAYGVIALVLGLAARWAALWIVLEAGSGAGLAALMAAGALSRAAMVPLMAVLPHARDGGLSRGVGAATPRAAVLAAAVAAGAALVLLGWAAIPAAIWAALLTWGLGALARTRIGGQTGDVLGAAQQLAEIAVLATLAA